MQKKLTKVEKRATIEIVKKGRNFTFFPFVLELMQDKVLILTHLECISYSLFSKKDLISLRTQRSSS